MTQFVSQFVVLRHYFPDTHGQADHWDLMIVDPRAEDPQRPLATWRIGHWPPRANQTVRRIINHRLDYLSYEGPVSGNRGRVRRVCKGVCQLECAETNDWQFRLVFPDNARPIFIRLTCESGVAGDCWQLSCKIDS